MASRRQSKIVAPAPPQPTRIRGRYSRKMRGLWEVWRTIVFADLDLRRTDAAGDLLEEFGKLFAPDRLGPFLTELGIDHNSTVAAYVRRLMRTAGVRRSREFPPPRDLIEAFRARNLSLIKSLGDDHVRDLQSTLTELQSKGATVDTIRTEISLRLNVGGRRALLLARDQTNKLNGQMQAVQQQSAGITRFRWSTSKDADVRPSHAALDGRVFEYANPPIVDGEPAIPGEPIQCRCQAIPVIDLFERI